MDTHLTKALDLVVYAMRRHDGSLTSLQSVKCALTEMARVCDQEAMKLADAQQATWMQQNREVW